MRKGRVTSQTGAVDEVGECGETEHHLEGHLGNGVKTDKLLNPYHVRCPSIPSKSQSVAGLRAILPPLLNTSHTSTHPD